MRQLENEGLDWLEQPVMADDFNGMVEVKAKTSTPLMMDEGLRRISRHA